LEVSIATGDIYENSESLIKGNAWNPPYRKGEILGPRTRSPSATISIEKMGKYHNHRYKGLNTKWSETFRDPTMYEKKACRSNNSINKQKRKKNSCPIEEAT